MKSLGRFKSSFRDENDTLCVIFGLENENVVKELDSKKDNDLIIQIEKYEEKRSNQANRYLWEMCTQIAQKLVTTKDTVYLMKLADYGVYVDLSIRIDAFNDTYKMLLQEYKYIEELLPDGMYRNVRCYIGSSHYDKKQMSKLLQGVVQDARDLGIDTWDDAEINMFLRNWKEK